MNRSTLAGAICAVAVLGLTVPVGAQQTQGGTTPLPATDGGAATPTPAPTPAPPPPAGTTELPPVEVIQKEAEPPKAAEKKIPPKKKLAATPPPTQPAQPQVPGTGGIDDGTVLMSPVEGSAIPIGKYPGGVGRASASDIERSGHTYVPDVLQQTVPGAILEDAQGNVFQRNLQYRGFDSSPVNGVTQGLAVYQNGVRINESFGDIVNWDFLPDNAIDGITIVGANPVFGLNALGGAVTVLMRDGFNFQGTELEFEAGSFGRVQGSLATGQRSGNWAAFLALEDIKDDGFRAFSESKIRRMYADLGVKDDTKEFHVNFTGADNFVGALAATPVQLLDLGWSRTYTSPQTTDNQVAMVSANGMVKATPTLTFSGVTYYRWFQQKHNDGNILEAVDCGGVVCFASDDPSQPPEPAINDNGHTMPFDPATSYGSLDKTSQDANSWGAAGQGVDKSRVFGLPNQFLLGSSYDHGRVAYTASSELGFIGPQFVVNSFSPPFFLQAPDDFTPRNLTTQNDYIGVYFSDTLDLTSKLALTVGGRYNFARLKITDNTGNDPEVDGDHTYERFNPMSGLTYEIMPGLTAYGSYAEANRAPTPAELSCADPFNPCLIESFLTADPPLQQVISRTFELGLRGKLASRENQRLEWSAGLFRALNVNDILPLAAPTSGRGFFQNAGDTLRQGVELGLRYTEQRWMAYANYAFVDATFQTNLQLPSPNNPSPTVVPCATAPAAECVNVTKGDRLPGVPQNRFKSGFDYWITHQWKFGGDLTVASNQIFYGDWNNTDAPLPGYATVDLHTSYDVNEHVQVYGLINNLFDSHYGLFGNFFDLEAANNAGRQDGLGGHFFTDPRTITPSEPLVAYGGLKVKF